MNDKETTTQVDETLVLDVAKLPEAEATTIVPETVQVAEDVGAEEAFV
jgi:hypothetical protein